MEPFTRFKAVAMPVDIINCDTDQIIPARFLRRDRTDNEFHRFFFHDLRFNPDETEKPEFIYNKAPFRHARIVVADLNWGCGSSREGAVYALMANNFRCVIAPSFGDIHYNNCMKWGVLPVRLDRAVCDDLRAQLHADPGAEIAVDLEAQTVTAPDGTVHAFEMAPFDRHRMLQGLDDIELTEQYRDAFAAFETAHRADYGWLS